MDSLNNNNNQAPISGQGGQQPFFSDQQHPFYQNQTQSNHFINQNLNQDQNQFSQTVNFISTGSYESRVQVQENMPIQSEFSPEIKAETAKELQNNENSQNQLLKQIKKNSQNQAQQIASFEKKEEKQLKLFGYTPKNQDIIKKAKNSTIGNVVLARTWLIVLLERLLKMQ